MARVNASEARRRLFHLLDAAERGEDVVLERRGVRFRLVVDRGRPDQVPSSPLLVADPGLLDGDWTWSTGPDGQIQYEARTEE